MAKQTITILDNKFTIHRFEAEEPIPQKSLKVNIIGLEKLMKNYRLCVTPEFHLTVQKVMGIGQF